MLGQAGYWTAFYRGNRAHVWFLLLVLLVVATVPWIVGEEGDPLALTVALIVAAFLQLLPAGIALHRQHPMRTSILVFSVLLGWLWPIWIALLIWATTRPGRLVLV